MSIITKSVLHKLRQIDTATVCNVIELFDVRPRNRGFMLREIGAAFPDLAPMVGFASTVTSRTFAAPMDGTAVATVPDVIARFDELSGPPVVLIQCLDSGGSAAIFGDVMCNSFSAFGAAGLVTDGPARDLDQVEKIGFPVFHRGIVCSHGYNHLLDIHVPVQVGGIAVAPDDLLHGDGNGVTTIPQSIAADVADACAEFAAAEAVVINLTRSGSPSLAELRDAYREKTRLIAALGTRLRRQALR